MRKSQDMVINDINKILPRVTKASQVFKENKRRSKELMERLDKLEAKLLALKIEEA
jgi:hypothetical protein